MTVPSLLIGDIGGTNVRFAFADPAKVRFSGVRQYRCSEFSGPIPAIEAHLTQFGGLPPDIICLAVAGPVSDNAAKLTNNDWIVDGSNLCSAFDAATAKVINDFEAIAISIPFLGRSDVVSIGADNENELSTDDYSVAVIGPGTGLGCAGLQKRGDDLAPIVSEAGHLPFKPENKLQANVLKVLQNRFDVVTDEHMVSGPGLENIYQALAANEKEALQKTDAAEIFARAQLRQDPVAVESVQLFIEVLGQVAGKLALSLGTMDGVYIAGGIMKRYPELFADSRFRSAFAHTGGNQQLMNSIPTRLITHENPGLLGAAYVARKLYLQA